MSVQDGWILPVNLRPCLDLLARVGETTLEDSTEAAFEEALNGTDAAQDRWYSLTLGRLGVQLARADGHRIHLRVEAPHGFGRAVDAVTLACATYRLEAAHG